MIAYLSLLVAIAGALVYLSMTKPEPKELGRITFACGLLVFLLTVVGGKIVSLVR